MTNASLTCRICAIRLGTSNKIRLCFYECEDYEKLIFKWDSTEASIDISSLSFFGGSADDNFIFLELGSNSVVKSRFCFTYNLNSKTVIKVSENEPSFESYTKVLSYQYRHWSMYCNVTQVQRGTQATDPKYFYLLYENSVTGPTQRNTGSTYEYYFAISLSLLVVEKSSGRIIKTIQQSYEAFVYNLKSTSPTSIYGITPTKEGVYLYYSWVFDGSQNTSLKNTGPVFNIKYYSSSDDFTEHLIANDTSKFALGNLVYSQINNKVYCIYYSGLNYYQVMNQGNSVYVSEVDTSGIKFRIADSVLNGISRPYFSNGMWCEKGIFWLFNAGSDLNPLESGYMGLLFPSSMYFIQGNIDKYAVLKNLNNDSYSRAYPITEITLEQPSAFSTGGGDGARSYFFPIYKFRNVVYTPTPVKGHIYYNINNEFHILRKVSLFDHLVIDD